MNYKGPLDPNGALFKSLSDNSINETTFVDEKESKNLLSISTDLSKNNETFFNEKEKSDYLKMETDFLIKLERPFCFYVGKENEEERVQNKETGRNLDQYLIEFLIDSIAQTKVLNRRSLKDDISISKSY
ncbi:hypothetical protein MHBO_004423 [Bonamia ostreae]|uniref:Uncharacterized protein n=1 Tax=Bonamia ostreae TaxID=126728 RepID=A0ABV2ATB0_9EUKA